jgi:type I restriction-modification system DNA methylase subunit
VPRLLEADGFERAVEIAWRADPGTKTRWRREADALLKAMKTGMLERSNEVTLHAAFLEAVFGRLLGYTSALSGSIPFTLTASPITEVDATEADGSLGWFTAPNEGSTRAVIELKDARTELDNRQLSRRDKMTPVAQAFGYGTKFRGCRWVIVSNFSTLRLYSVAHSQAVYESFDLLSLSDDAGLLRFVALMSPDALIGSDVESHGYLVDLLAERPIVRQREISSRFYAHYARLRDELIAHFIEQAKDVHVGDLITAAQKILDRILFICFAEDTRTLLPHELLKRTAAAGQASRSRSPTKVWAEIRELFRDIDEGRSDVPPEIPGYNGGLFAFDALIDEKLVVDERLTLELVRLSDYDYQGQITVEILGHILEESIADLEQIHREYLSLVPFAAGRDQTAIDERRRELGVYYTRRWVTEYIITATVGEIAAAKDHELAELEKLLIVDPACGSGAFLAEAYRYLTDVTASKVAVALPGEQQPVFGTEALASPSRLLAPLRGVDLMPEAVEIARLSLWLASASKREKLSNLTGIKQGNTLTPKSDETLFPEQKAAGGFDVVIGNPPWGAEINYTIDRSLTLATGQFDSYELFIQRAIRDLLGNDGMFGFIIPDMILRPEGERLRRWLFDNYQVVQMIKLGEGVFTGVFRASVIIIVRKAPPTDSDMVRTLVVLREDRDILEEAGSSHLHSLMEDRGGLISRSRVVSDEHYDVPLGATDEDVAIVETMRARSLRWIGPDGVFGASGRGVELGAGGLVVRCAACSEWQVGPRARAQVRGGGFEDKVCEFCGVTLRNESDFTAKAQIIVDRPPETVSIDRRLPGKGWRRILRGEDVSRYELGGGKWIRMGVPNINYKEDDLYKGPKILIRKTGFGINVAVDESDSLCVQVVYVYKVRAETETDPYYLLGCLASRAMLFAYARITNQVEWQSYPQQVQRTLQSFPLPDPRLNTKQGKRIHDTIATLARKRMGLRPEDGHELDLEIEQHVMDAYGLSADQRLRIHKSLRSLQRLRVIREMFPDEEKPSHLRLVE